MTTEVENIILNKEYFELTPEELATVNELVSSAEEYEEMKWFLASTQQALVSEKIEATPELKESVMGYLHQDEKKRRFWLNSVGVFLWPEDKRFFQRPAFQMSLAALLLIGFIMVYDRPLEDQNMAVNDVPIDSTAVVNPDGAGGSVSDADNVTEVDGTKEFAVVEDEEVLDDVLNNRSLATEYESTELNPLQPVLSSLDAESSVDADALPQDGYYTGPSEDADDVSVDENAKILTSGNVQSKSNANNNESFRNDANTIVLADEVDNKNYKDDKDKRRESRDALKKSELKKGKLKDGKSSGSRDDIAETVSEEEVDETSSGENGGGGAYGLTNNVGNNTSNELNQNMSTTPVGGVYNGAPEVNNEPGNVSADDFDDTPIVLEEKEQQIIKPHQLHIDSTKELKSLFKTMK